MINLKPWGRMILVAVVCASTIGLSGCNKGEKEAAESQAFQEQAKTYYFPKGLAQNYQVLAGHGKKNGFLSADVLLPDGNHVLLIEKKDDPTVSKFLMSNNVVGASAFVTHVRRYLEALGPVGLGVHKGKYDFANPTIMPMRYGRVRAIIGNVDYSADKDVFAEENTSFVCAFVTMSGNRSILLVYLPAPPKLAKEPKEREAFINKAHEGFEEFFRHHKMASAMVYPEILDTQPGANYTDSEWTNEQTKETQPMNTSLF